MGKTSPMKGKENLKTRGENHPRWKGGSKTNEYTAAYSKEYRHKVGISKKYNSELGISYTKEYKKLQRQRRKSMIKLGGNLPIERIQMVYEDNIKKYGTLTCYLCLKCIKFGEDSLEHKIPLSCGGTNEYNNLAVACRSCNSSKGAKTTQEYILYKTEVLKNVRHS